MTFLLTCAFALFGNIRHYLTYLLDLTDYGVTGSISSLFCAAQFYCNLPSVCLLSCHVTKVNIKQGQKRKKKSKTPAASNLLSLPGKESGPPR